MALPVKEMLPFFQKFSFLGIMMWLTFFKTYFLDKLKIHQMGYHLIHMEWNDPY